MSRAKTSAKKIGTEDMHTTESAADATAPAEKDYEDVFDTTLDQDDDFDVEDDVAFLNEEDDVFDMDDVLDLRDVSEPDSFD